MTLRSLVAFVALLIVTKPAHAYLFGPSCSDPAIVKAFVAEAQCSLVTCRGGLLNKSVDEIKALSASQLDAILLEKQKAGAAKLGGDVPPAIVQYGAMVRGFAANMYLHMSRINLAVARTSEISHYKSELTCSAEITFNVAEAREALYNQIAVKVYSQPDDAASLLSAIEAGDTKALDQSKATDRAAWLGQIDRKLKSPRSMTFVVSAGPKGPVVTTPKVLLMD